MMVIRKLGSTDIKYKIICAGSGFDVGVGKIVTVNCGGKSYVTKMHSKTKGRIDGLGALFRDFSFVEGQELSLNYNSFTNCIEIKIVSNQCLVEKVQPSKTREEMSTDSYSEPLFDGEYYDNLQIEHRIAKYKTVFYFLYNSQVVCYKDGDSNTKSIVVNDVKMDYYDSGIFVNRHGIFVYATGRDRGCICKLYGFDGKEKGCFKIQRKGSTSEKNRIKESVYIIDDYFYCLSDKEYFVYHFGTNQLYSSSIILPKDEHIVGICVTSSKVYLKIVKGYNNFKWCILRTSDDLLYSTGEIKPMFSNLGDRKVVFLNPKKDSIWISGDRADEYAEVKLSVRKFTGRKCYVSTDRIHNVVYFDGNVMYGIVSLGRWLFEIDLKTGISKNELTGIFEATKLYVLNNKYYVTKDYGFFNHYIVERTVGEEEDSFERRICERLW